MSTHNICFYEDLTKIIFEISSNKHLISSAEISSYSYFCSKQTEDYRSESPDKYTQSVFKSRNKKTIYTQQKK